MQNSSHIFNAIMIVRETDYEGIASSSNTIHVST